MFECPRCGHTCEPKQQMERHLSRKYPCEPTLSNISRENALSMLFPPKPKGKFLCKKGCGKSFAHQSSQSRHEKDCLGEDKSSTQTQIEDPKPQAETTVETGNNSLSGEHNVFVMASKDTTVENNTINLVINITPLSEITPQLSYEKFVQLMHQGALSTILTLIEENHFGKPEGMNVYISNLKDKIGRIFEKNGWKVCDAATLSKDMLDMYQKSVDDLMDDVDDVDKRDEIRVFIGDLLLKKVDHFGKRWTRQTEHEEFEAHAKKEIGFLLYNNRDKVRETHNLRY